MKSKIHLNASLLDGQIKKLQCGLSQLYKYNSKCFKKIFIEGNMVKQKFSRVDEFMNMGIVERINSYYHSRFMICSHKGIFVVTDPPSLRHWDRVFPLFADESLLFADQVNVKEGDTVMDLGTGSGILALSCAKKASKVYGVDINKKAVDYAQFNAKLNNLQKRVQFLKGDMFSPIGNLKFDLIVSNPPFVPVPPDFRFYLHSSGGTDGLEVVRRILKSISKYLKPDGRFQIIVMSPGNKNSPIVVQDLKKYMRNRKVKITLTNIYENPVELSSFIKCFREARMFMAWKQYFSLHSLTHLYYLFVDLRPADSFSLNVSTRKIRLRKNYYSGDWQSRFKRYALPE